MTKEKKTMLGEEKPLTPITSGVIVLVGTKASNLDDTLKKHPQVVIWSSQEQHWTNKDLPANTRAVLMTRFLGHSQFSKIVTEARKRQIAIYNPSGTGKLTRYVKELLNMPTEKAQIVQAHHTPPAMVTGHSVQTEAPKAKKSEIGKLRPLHQFIDYTKTNLENGKALLMKAQELGITSTEKSLTQLVSNLRRRSEQGVKATAVPKTRESREPLDVSVEMLDNAIQELKDIRSFLVATVKENAQLKGKLAKFKKMMEE